MAIVETIFFYLLAFGALFSSILVVAQRNPLYSALALILDFFCFAGLYALLSAHFMAVAQVLVYGGAIMVLFVFIIMLLNLRDEEIGPWRFRVHHTLAIAVVVSVFVMANAAITQLVERGRVKSEHARTIATWEQKVANTPEGEEPPPISHRTRSPVSGLYLDLNEQALESEFQRKLVNWRSGKRSPADKKYARYSETGEEEPMQMPPVLNGQDARGGPLNQPVTFGTIEPISILLVNRFVVPFELTALMLLAAIVGAVIIAKKRL